MIDGDASVDPSSTITSSLRSSTGASMARATMVSIVGASLKQGMTMESVRVPPRAGVRSMRNSFMPDWTMGRPGA